MKENKKFIPIWLYIFGGFVISAFIVIETYLAISNGKSFSFDIYEGTFKVITFFMVIIAIILTYKRMMQTKEQTDALTENNRYRNYQDHLVKFNNHFAEDKFIKIIADINRIEKNIIINSIYRFYYYHNHKDFLPTYNKEAKQFIYDYINPLVNFIISEGNINRDDSSFILDSFLSIRHIDYSNYFETISDKALRNKEKDQRDKLYYRMVLHFHLKLLVKLSAFERITGVIEEDLVTASKTLKNYLSTFRISETWGI